MTAALVTFKVTHDPPAAALKTFFLISQVIATPTSRSTCGSHPSRHEHVEQLTFRRTEKRLRMHHTGMTSAEEILRGAKKEAGITC